MSLHRIGLIILYFYKIYSTQAVRNSEPSVISAEPGEAVNLTCTFVDDSNKDVRMWYKQRLEHAPLEVGSKLDDKPAVISGQFDKSRFKLNRIASGISLSIERVTKEDEGMYFCGETGKKTLDFSNATFLAVTGQSDISVLQTPVRGSVSPGESIIFGNGASVELKDPIDPVLMFLGAALGVCVVVISAQAFIICKRRNSDHCSGKTCQSIIHSFPEILQDQDSDAEEFSFAPLNFSDKSRLLKENAFTRVRFFPVSDFKPIQKHNIAEKRRK
ncbi:hypothetical protein SRHO_G00124980 [Serrasalmus rhombeus]